MGASGRLKLEGQRRGNSVFMQTKLNFGNWEHIWSNAALGAEWKIPEHQVTVRGKVNANLTCTTSITHELPKYGTYTFGLEWSSIGHQNNFKFGTALSLEL